jgi:hypothetical protein
MSARRRFPAETAHRILSGVRRCAAMTTICPPRANRTRDSLRGARAPCARPCRPLTWAAGRASSGGCPRRMHRRVRVRARAAAIHSPGRGSGFRGQTSRLASDTAKPSRSWGTTGRRPRCSTRRTWCRATGCSRASTAATRCARSSASVCAGRAASSGCGGGRSCR